MGTSSLPWGAGCGLARFRIRVPGCRGQLGARPHVRARPPLCAPFHVWTHTIRWGHLPKCALALGTGHIRFGFLLVTFLGEGSALVGLTSREKSRDCFECITREIRRKYLVLVSSIELGQLRDAGSPVSSIEFRQLRVTGFVKAGFGDLFRHEVSRVFRVNETP